MAGYKKLFKRLFLFLLTAFLLLMLAIAIALNFVFTPEKITPQIVELINKNVNATVTCQTIDPAFFSTFPNFSITLKNGSIVNYKVLKDEKLVEFKNDTLAKFESLQLTFNLIKLLQNKEVDIKKASFINPEIHALINENGFANWNILKTSESETEIETDTTSIDATKYLKTFNVDKLEIVNANLHYEDLFTKALVDIPVLNLDLTINKNEEGVDLNVNTNGLDIVFIKDEVRFLNKLKLTLKTDVNYNKQNKELVFGKSILNTNNIEFLADGNIKINKPEKQVFTNLNLRLNVPSLKTFIDLIPENILEYKKDLITEGEVVLNAHIIGAYGKDVFPDINAQLNIENGSFKFKNFPGEIETFQADITSTIDFNTLSNSNVTIDKLELKGTGIHLNSKGTITNVIQNASVNASLNGDIDFTKLKEAFPINKNIDASGIAKVDFKTSFTKKAIINQDYKRINASGTMLLKNVNLHHKTEDFKFQSQNADVIFGREFTSEVNNDLNGRIDFKGLTFKYKNKHQLTLEYLNLVLDTQVQASDNKTLHAEISLKDLNYAYGDSIKGMIKNSHAKVLFKSTAYKKRPLIVSQFTIDSVAIWGYKRFIGMKNGNYNLTFENDETKHWQPKGSVEFNALYVNTPKFPLLLEMKQTVVSIKNNDLLLNKAAFKFGNSDATLTGKVSHFIASLQNKKDFEAELNLDADYIDTNQLMSILNSKQEASTEIIDPNTIKTDTTATSKKSTFIVPDNIQFTFNTNIKKVRFDNLDFTNIHGLVTLKNQELDLQNLYLETLAANIIASLNYKAKTEDEAEINYKMNLEHIQMKNLTALFPTLDSLFPMSKSFDGKVDFRMKGSAKLNKDMHVLIPSVKSIAALQAKNLIVFDSPTFAEISKTLMFKNKERNLIDSFHVEMSIENSQLEIFPAELTLDRYRIAAGGIQNLDKTYNYHISILKSPVPFKAGVDVLGDFEDYNIDITKAKYKYYFTEKERLLNKADSTVINKKLSIQKELDF
ncbi:DUF3971 domain-containing protein [Formosa maritima]|uniref:DUF3971 domain-containing protein n=1 Tax=Formosa maritima TaxID=2592046 RepID=A0A5D0G2X4_9FLAO|nr:DUF3971 domain-containing protein [Formosa maritima]TYA52980.1 DUF3971 domain-containing protein [Formosa maritima]